MEDLKIKFKGLSQLDTIVKTLYEYNNISSSQDELRGLDNIYSYYCDVELGRASTEYSWIEVKNKHVDLAGGAEGLWRVPCKTIKELKDIVVNEFINCIREL